MRKSFISIGVALLLGAAQAAAQTADSFIKITVSTNECQKAPGDPLGSRFVVYIDNTSTDKRISANVSKDTQPSGQHFAMLDNQLGNYTEQFPTFYEHRLAPQERRQIGCTEILRISPNGSNYSAIPVVYSVAGAVFVDPSAPLPPPEDPKQFMSFMILNLPNNNSCLSSNPGFYIATNTHPTRNTSSDVDVINDHGGKAGYLIVNLPAQGNVRLTCTHADIVNFALSDVSSSQFTTPP